MKYNDTMKTKISKIVLATTNKGKLKEFQETLSVLGIKFQSIDELAQDFDVEETGTTFLENSILKAQAAAKLTGEYCLADDSGLEVKALNGRPGIFSGRYLKGEDIKEELRTEDYEMLKTKHADIARKYLEEHLYDQHCFGVFRLLEEMIGKGERACRFVCSLVLIAPDGEIVFKTENYWEGILSNEPRGVNGFGYDPIVIPEGMDKTISELDSETKNKLSHRAQAIEALKKYLK